MSAIALSKPPRSILIVRLTARGDVVFATPLIRAFRRTYPGARITWLAESHTADLVLHNPHLDEVIVWNRKEWKRLLRRGRLLTLGRLALDFVRELRSREFDLAVDVHGLLRAGAMTYLSGAPTRVGLGSTEGSSLLMTHVIPRDSSDLPQVASEYLYIARELGLDVSDFRLDVVLSQKDEESARGIITREGLTDGYAVICPFTTRDWKHWFEDRWANLVDRMQADLGLTTVILGGPDDREADRRIREAVRGKVVSLVGKTSLSEAAALVKFARLLVGVDTGLTHVASAFERPTVALFGSNIPYSEPPTDRTRIIVHRLECTPCKHYPTCDGDYTCMRLITVDEVLNTAREVLEVGESG
ncbi:MAG: lipopolysaccharide heptosyltransferase [Gemmatimonadetes bacterium]|nr:lipopolysaccharide heptosyltransferase [Gemmatimonadota bacterium]NIO31949.1 lipopolysaccharide heptosyltransferase [Gemmatimonadota bacterium]